ncbi:MAG: hypothetical protein ABI321_15930 [Polyangia bacterium]
MRLVLALAVLLSAGVASAQDLTERFSARASLSGMYLTETQSGLDDAHKIAGPLHLGYGELRLTLDGRRLGHWDLHVDGRIRLTGSLTPASLGAGDSETTARGYLGGREYQLYEAYARGHFGKLDVGIGRMLITEADALRIDGVKLWVKLQKRWGVGVYGGGYSDPYSRSLATDYVKHAPAFVGGAAARYDYDRIGGSFSLNAAYLGGKDDGGPVIITAQNAGGNPQTENVRSYVTWTNFWRPIKYIDFYNDLVIDLWGAAKTQLTRLDFYVAGHVTKNVTIRAGYDHMSAIAIEMYLTRLLNDRTTFIPNTIENNLTLSRTARDEGRLTIEGQTGRTSLTAEGRIRRRTLVTPSNDPQFIAQPGTPDVGNQVAPSLGYDATLSVRNSGSLAGLRPSAWLTYLHDYRALNVYAGVGLGRDFLRDRLSIDLTFTYANVRDAGANQTCTTTGNFASITTTLQTCYGTRKGNDLQAGFTIGTTPTRHWFAFVDYRAGIQITDNFPRLLTHVLVGRVEARY